jgi:hypothetical protein
MGSINNIQSSEDLPKSPPPTISSTFGPNIDHQFLAVDATENGILEERNNNLLTSISSAPPPPLPPLSPSLPLPIFHHHQLNYSNENEQHQQYLFLFRQQKRNEERFDQLNRRLENIER